MKPEGQSSLSLQQIGAGSGLANKGAAQVSSITAQIDRKTIRISFIRVSLPK
jgi:hypothetical protein